MSFNKNLIALAIAGGLLSTAAQAQVDITAGAGADPVLIASELNIAPAGSVITNAANALDVEVDLQYNFSESEVRYARIECTDTIEFETAVVTSSNAAAAIGAVNGVGTNAINFSITAPALGLDEDDTLIIAGNRRVLEQGGVSCTYSLYDQPSQATNGGPDGLIVTSGGGYLAFASSYLYNIVGNTSTANVEADPSFTAFVLAGNPTNNTARARLATIEFNTREIVDAPPQPIKANGTPALLADILAAGSRHIVEGDFSAAANSPAGTFTGDALQRVFISAAADCSVVTTAATSMTATSATFVTGAAAVNGFLCYTPTAGRAIPASEYTFRFAPVSNAGYTAGTLGPVDSGEIVRNGTELQAPLAQIPGDYISRLVLTNTGSIARPYTAEILRETGNAGTPGSAVTGTIPANGTLVVNMADVLGTFTSGQPRGTVNVTVAGPNAQIQGLYQIVKPDTGSISNHVMVRPGTN